MIKYSLIAITTVILAFSLSGCNNSFGLAITVAPVAQSASPPQSLEPTKPPVSVPVPLVTPVASPVPDVLPSVELVPVLSPVPSPSPLPVIVNPRTYQTDVLLFSGSGTWSAEVASIESILTSHGATYQAVSSSQLNAMSATDIAKFGLIIIPGGAGGTEGQSLTLQTHANIRTAVQVNGVSYLGFCAGAFLAVAPASEVATDTSYIGVVDGPILDYYYLENQGTDIAMTLQSFADGSTQDILWYGGPVTPNVPGGVIAKYPDGNPAITEVWSGNGFVIISGGHPSATQAMLSGVGMVSTDGLHFDLTWRLIEGALNQAPLAAF